MEGYFHMVSGCKLTFSVVYILYSEAKLENHSQVVYKIITRV